MTNRTRTSNPLYFNKTIAVLQFFFNKVRKYDVFTLNYVRLRPANSRNKSFEILGKECKDLFLMKRNLNSCG